MLFCQRVCTGGGELAGVVSSWVVRPSVLFILCMVRMPTLPLDAVPLVDYPGFHAVGDAIYGPSGKALRVDAKGRVQLRNVDGRNVRVTAEKVLKPLRPDTMDPAPTAPVVVLPAPIVPSSIDVSELLRSRVPSGRRDAIRSMFRAVPARAVASEARAVASTDEYAKYAADYSYLVAT